MTGTIVTAVSTFTGAARNLLDLMIGESRPVTVDGAPRKNPPMAVNIAGQWTTGVLTNPFDRTDTFTLTFDFDVKGDALLGTLRKTATPKGYDIEKGILGGTIKDNVISFYTPEAQLESYAPDRLLDGSHGDFSSTGFREIGYRDLYYGSVLNDHIDFILQSDRPRGFPAQKFVAKRK